VTTTGTTTSSASTRALVERAIRFERETSSLVSDRIEEHPLGRWIRCSAHPKLWSLNQLYVEGPHPDLTVGELTAELDRGLADATHRRVIVEDDATGRALSEPMREAGYGVVPLMVMLLEREPPAPPAGVVREVDNATMRVLQARLLEDDDEVPEADRPVVAAGQGHVREVIPGTRCYAGMVDGEDVCQTILYTDGHTGQPEHVITLPTARGHGIAAATVSQATRDAVAAGCDLVFMVCDAALGPFALYSDLGYRAAGRFWAFTKAPSG
jgi:hypothetical protein